MIKYITALIMYFNVLHPINAQDIKVTLSATDKQCKTGSASISILSGALPIQYVWSNGATTDYIENLEAGNYWVTVTAGNAKDTTISFIIAETICEPIAENNFTPNGDAFNDTWNISRLDYFPEFELIVYNRWGQQVHHQSQQYVPWAGTQFGLPLPDGAYYYILFLKKSDNHKFIKGDVNILR